MQCKHCGSEWKTNARTNVIIRCPFCGAELEQEKEDKLTFQNAKEALRYIIKTYGVDVIFDGLQLKTALDEFIPDLKQERKVFMDAYEYGVCNALYLAHEEPEIDKCIAILQSIKVLTQEACMAEKWACYVVETYVYALNWNVPMFGITPNIHMYQIPESIHESGDNGKGDPMMIQSGGVWEEQGSADDGDMWNSSNAKKGKKGNFVLPSKKPNQLPEPAPKPVEPEKPKEEVPAPQPVEEFKPESPEFDFTDDGADEKPAAPQPVEEFKPESPVFDFTDDGAEDKPAAPQPVEEFKPESPVFDFTDDGAED